MATAVELLSQNIEEVLVIDSSLRTINIPPSVTNIGVESDDETTRLNFKMPRYNDGVDLSDFVVRINYENANGEGDVYSVTDKVVNDDTITFSWLVGRFAVQYRGTVKFIVCLKKFNADSTIDKEFNTTVATLPVLEGLETDEVAAEVLPDAISAVAYEAVLLALDNGLKGDPGYTPVKGTDYFTSAERDEFAEEVVNAAKGVYANAYKQTVNGEVIRVDDVSPLEHTVGVRVYGKNLLPYPYRNTDKTVDGVTFTVQSDGGIALSGMPTSSFVAFELYKGAPLVTKGKIKISLLGEFEGIYIRYDLKDSNGNSLLAGGAATSNTIDLDQYPSATEWNIFVRNVDNVVAFGGVAYPQIELGDITTDYEPYVDPSTVTLTRCGKNLLPLTTFTYTPSSSKATVVDGVLTVTGYIAAHRVSAVGLIGKRLTLSCTSTRTGEKGGGLAVEFRDPSNNRISGVYHQNELSPKLSFTIPEGTATIVVFFYASGNAESTGTATYRKVQLELGEEVTEHALYVGNTYTPAANGVVENVYSISPSMTLYTDTPGVTIEAEYSRDTNALIGDISAALDVLIGIQEATIAKLDNMTGGVN